MRFLRDLFDRVRGPGYRCQDCDHWFTKSHICGDRGQHIHAYLRRGW